MDFPKKASRRSFLTQASWMGAASVITNPLDASAGKTKSTRPATRAKNLIFLVADGMGTGTLSLTNHWSLRHQNRPTHWMDLYNQPGWVNSLQDTASASSSVTDSAAAASAWGSGQRVNNRSINYSTGGKALEPIFVTAKKAGKATGLVSTCRITHATPAAFVANMENRDEEDAIAEQYLQREMDVYLGGGLRHFQSKKRDLLPAFIQKGYDVCRNVPDLINTDERRSRLIGLFSDGHLPYAIDRANDPSLWDIPSLEQMFQSSLDTLSDRPEGFVLQVEAGRVDHAGHVNDPATILQEQLEFDRCIPIAVDFQERNPDTLVIVTTDHGTGGCQFNGLGDGYNGSDAALDRINRFTGSFESLEKVFRKNGNFDRRLFQQVTGIEANEEQVDKIQADIERGQKYLTSTLADLFTTELMKTCGVGWTSHQHTAEHVEFLARGPGADAIPRRFDNNQLHGCMIAALGLDHARQ
ncbi:MAG: alkaline phosphatase [Coraliomargaritaceae bacterium]